MDNADGQGSRSSPFAPWNNHPAPSGLIDREVSTTFTPPNARLAAPTFRSPSSNRWGRRAAIPAGLRGARDSLAPLFFEPGIHSPSRRETEISSTRHTPEKAALQFTSARSWQASILLRAVPDFPSSFADSVYTEEPVQRSGSNPAVASNATPAASATSARKASLRM